MIDRRIKFRHIQCFVEIARSGSMKAAAEGLYLTQPAISKTLKELEDILGVTLLTRSRAGIALTPEGETFLQYSQASVAAIQQGIAGIEVSVRGTDSVTVGVLPSVAARLIPQAAQRFARSAPDVLLRMVDGPHSYLLDRLKLGSLDLVVGRMGSFEQMAGLSFTTLYREQVAFVVRPDHPLLDGVTLDDLRHWPVIYPPEGSVIRRQVDQFLIEQGIGELSRRLETVSGAFGRVHTRNSDAIWIISEGVVAIELAAGVLARLPIDSKTTLGSIGITKREDYDSSPAARRFIRALREAIASDDLVSPV